MQSQQFILTQQQQRIRPYLSLLPHVSPLLLMPSLFGQIGHLQTQVTLHPGLVTERKTSALNTSYSLVLVGIPSSVFS